MKSDTPSDLSRRASEPTVTCIRDLFWERGYDKTSMEELVRATGQNRYALYTKYGNKRDLLLLSMESYVAAYRREFMALISDETLSPLGKLDGIFGLIHRRMTERANGCLMCNVSSEVAPFDETVSAACETYHQELMTVLTHMFDLAAAAGELRDGLSPVQGAHILHTHMLGLACRLKTGEAAAPLKDETGALMALLRKD